MFSMEMLHPMQNLREEARRLPVTVSGSREREPSVLLCSIPYRQCNRLKRGVDSLTVSSRSARNRDFVTREHYYLLMANLRMFIILGGVRIPDEEKNLQGAVCFQSCVLGAEVEGMY